MSRPYGPDAFVGADYKALYGQHKFLNITDDRHIRPFGAEEYPAQLQIDRHRWSDKKVGTMSRTELVFSHPPRYHPLKDRTQHARLRICKQLNTPDDDEAQTLYCRVEEQSADSGSPTRVLPRYVVAKVYDPMFYSGTDVVADADMEYAHESTAYARFELALDKQKTPNSTLAPSFQLEFFGCWFFLAPSQDPNFAAKTRPVRLILTESLVGQSISDMCGLNDHGALVPLDAKGLPILDPPTQGLTDVRNTNADIANNQISHWQRRMFIIDAIVDGLARQAHMGVQLVGNVRPDQIIVGGGPETVALAAPYSPHPAARAAYRPRVVLINYTRSITGKCTAYGAGALEELPRPCCPIDRDGHRSLASLRGWWPADWETLPEPDRTDIWSLWFQRTFDTPDYIRRTEAEPLLDKINDKIFDVQEDEEAKLPAKYRSNEYEGPDFYHATPNGMRDFIDGCIRARKERERLRAAERAETQGRETQDPAVVLPDPVVGSQGEVPTQAAIESAIRDLELAERKPILGKSEGKGISAEGQGKRSPDKRAGGSQGKENRPGDTTPSGSTRASTVVPTQRTLPAALPVPQVSPTSPSSPYSQAQPLQLAPHLRGPQNLANRPVASRQHDIPGERRSDAQASSTLRVRSQAKLPDNSSQERPSYGIADRSSPAPSDFPRASGPLSPLPVNRQEPIQRPATLEEWLGLGDLSSGARGRDSQGQRGAGRGRGPGRGGRGQSGSGQNRPGGRDNVPPS